MSEQNTLPHYYSNPPSPRSPSNKSYLTSPSRKGPPSTSQLPNSPPASHDSPADTSPVHCLKPSALTPPASVPMSTQPSQSSITSASHLSVMPDDGPVTGASPPCNTLDPGAKSPSSASLISPLKRSSSEDQGGNPPKRARPEQSNSSDAQYLPLSINQEIQQDSSIAQNPVSTESQEDDPRPDSQPPTDGIQYYKLGRRRK